MRRAAAIGTLLFVLVGPGLEAGVGPWLLTGGFEDAGDLPAWLAVPGWALIALGLAVLVLTLVGFARDGLGTPSPAAPPRELVVTGPYRYVRNPQYVATAAVIVGEGLVLGQPILLVAAAVYLAVLAVLHAQREAPLLRARFGPAYDAYAAAVPAWIPRLTPWTDGAGGASPTRSARGA
jgi:protein-S-isoprenylcysteine O-methyltransferase Ste14